MKSHNIMRVYFLKINSMLLLLFLHLHLVGLFLCDGWMLVVKMLAMNGKLMSPQGFSKDGLVENVWHMERIYAAIGLSDL